MRQLQKRKVKRRKRTKPNEPLAEGIASLTKSGRRRWASMEDKEIVAFAEAFVQKNDISRRDRLKNADSGLYEILRLRKLLDKVGFEEKPRDWGSLSDEQLVEHTRQFMKDEGIGGSSELKKADNGLYEALRGRKLLDKVGFERKKRKGRPWKGINDGELVSHAKRFVKKNEIVGRSGLQKADRGLYNVLLERKLLGKVGFEERQRNWKSLSDVQLVEHARKFMEENGISRRKELRKADCGLYNTLQKRKLLDKVGFEEKGRPKGFFTKMKDNELVGYAKIFMKENELSGRGELEKADCGLYEALRKRKMLDEVGFEKKHRDWASMSNDELVAYAKEVMEEKRISGRGELKEVDYGLYTALLRRKLLDQVFLDIEKAKQRHADDEVIRALEEFGSS